MNDTDLVEIGEKVAKRGRPKGSLDSYKRPGRDDLAMSGQSKPEETRLFLAQARWTASLPPIDWTDPEQVETRINEYLDNCSEVGLKPTVTGMCNAVGVSKSAVYTWEHGKYRAGTHQEIIIRYKRILEEFWEIQMTEGKINPVTGIFLGKNHFGYADKQEVVVTPNTPLGDDATPNEQLRTTYLDSVVIDEIEEEK